MRSLIAHDKNLPVYNVEVANANQVLSSFALIESD